jgi:endonuclease YncB( thermonuclease family)
MRRLIFLLAMLFVISAHDAVAEIAGRASVIDGDTIEIRGERIRLHGIDTPESSQLCDLDGQPYRCGQQAALALADKIGEKTVRCTEKDVDRYGRTVAVCFVGGEDINRWMTFQGWALAYRKYSWDYVDAEDEARVAGRGLWRGDFERPWDWRKEHPRGRVIRP